jgi:hypothetical protein
MARDRVVAMMKFGKHAHMEALIEHGTLYMQPLSTFKAMEEDGLRSDENEALSGSIAARGGSLSVQQDGAWQARGTIAGPLRIRGEVLESANVFCAHILLATRCHLSPYQLVDPRNFAFGDTFVIFMDADEFIRRVRAAVAARGLQMEADAVQYVDPKAYWGEMGVFRKYAAYSFQSEYRIALLPGSGESYTLQVGSLSDIALLSELPEINQRMSWTTEGRLYIRH